MIKVSVTTEDGELLYMVSWKEEMETPLISSSSMEVRGFCMCVSEAIQGEIKSLKKRTLAGRPENYETLSPREQWAIDKELGILDA
ncbi:MAG: hypothetical protein ACYSUN_11070 [Planctomycetota bacterium]|jgi:hypothetical protein